MFDQSKKLEEVLHYFEDIKEIYDTNDIENKLIELCKEARKTGSEPAIELFAETLAFDFYESSSRQSVWGTFFGPIFIGPNERGQQVEFPSIQHISPGIITYWGKRATEVKHPLMKARYSDLVWDFSKPVIGKAADVTMARLAIDSYLDIVRGKHFKHNIRAIDKLKRALNLALSINDIDRIQSVRDAIIYLENAIAEDDSPRLWGFSYDLLVDNTKVPLLDKQKETIIDILEQRFLRLCGISEGASLKVLKAERAAMRLVGYYRRLNRPDEVRRILKVYGDAFVKASQLGAGLLGLVWINKVYALYMDNGMKEEAEALNLLLRELGAKSASEMKPVRAEIKIPKKDIDAYISAMTEGNLCDALKRLAIHFLPDPEQVEAQVKDLARKFVFQSIIPDTILDHEGRIIAQIGPVDDDLEGRVIMQITENIAFENTILRLVIDNAFAKFSLSAKDLLDYLYISPIFDRENRDLIYVGLEAYYRKDHIAFASVILPLIESTLRHLLVLLKRPTYRPGRRGGLFLRNLDEILRDEGIRYVLGDRITKYLLVLLTDQRGLNFRNRVSHGLMPFTGFGEQVSDRLLHILLLLAQVSEKMKEA